MTTNPIEIETEHDSKPAHAVIWLHGLGADGHDFAGIVPALEMSNHWPAQTPMRFIFPHAPMRAITINDGMKMRGWYDIAGLGFEHEQDRNGIEHSAALLRALIERENERGIPCENIFLAGFSQGGAMVLHTGLRFGQPLAGLIALSTYLPLADSLQAEKSTANQHTSILMAHGVDDPMIPIALARRSEKQLTQSGYSVWWREYPMQHDIAPQEIIDVANFLRAHISS